MDYSSQVPPVNYQPKAEPQEPRPPLPPLTTAPVGKKSDLRFLKNKKILLGLPLIIIILIIVGILASRLGSIIKPGESGKLVYWGLWEEETVIEPIIAEYEKLHPKVKITYIKQSPTQYRDRLQNALNRGEGPDIFRFHNTWLPMLKNDLAPVPETVFDTNAYQKTFYEVSQSDLKIGTSYYGIPIYIDTLGLYINEDLFEKAGLTPPTTWEDLRKEASLLTEYDEFGRINISGIALGTTNNIDHWSDILGLMMVQNGVDFKKVDQTITADGKNRGEIALSYFTQFALVDKVWDETMPASTSMFAAGKLAMYFAPSWRVFEINKYNPSLRFKIIPVPQLAGVNYNWASYWVEGVAKKSTNQVTAWEFLKFLSTKETMAKLFQAESRERLFGEPYGRSDMSTLIESDHQYLGAILAQAKTAKSWFLCSNTYDNGLNDNIIKYFTDAVNSLANGITVTEALKTAALGVNQVLNQYQIN